ncbi:MAG TPA: amidase family protein [Mycobacteriales bacterium]
MNPSINAVVIVLGEQALDATKAADRAVAAGDDMLPFRGVPFTIKDNIDVVGTPTTQGFAAGGCQYAAGDALHARHPTGVAGVPGAGGAGRYEPVHGRVLR